MSLKNSIILIAIVLASVDGARILGIFPYPYYSHQKLHHTIIRELLQRGHQITVFTTHPYDYHDNPNVTQHHFKDTLRIHEERTDMLLYKRSRLNWMQIIFQYELGAFYESTKSEMEHPAMQDLVHNSSAYSFDLLMIECILCPWAILADIFDCPIVNIAASDAHELIHMLMGDDTNPMRYSETMFSPHINGHLSFVEKLTSLHAKLVSETALRLTFFWLNSMLGLKYFGHLGMRKALNFPYDRVGLLMTNTNVHFGHVRALMPNSIQIGYIHIERARPLVDRDLKNYLDMSENGVIVMSLGSRADSRNLGLENVQKFMKAFNQSHMNVLWKLHKVSDVMEVPHNVKLVEWMQLADVLAHPNVKVLIHHGGLLTSYEAIDREVPMIIFPLAYDQYMNARLMSRNGFAMELDLNGFDEEQLLDAIQMVKGEGFRENVRKMRELAYDKPISSRDLMVWHVENLIRNRVVYSKDFGTISVFQAPLLHIFVYFGVFLGSLVYLVRRKF